MKNYITLSRLLLILMGLLLIGCKSSATLPTENSSETDYPLGSVTNLPIGSYPSNSPRSTSVSAEEIVTFHLNKPVLEGAILVSGNGPAGVPLSLQDVTFMGDLLSQTIIGADGTFVFQVAALEKNHRIGIALGDLTGTRWKPEDFYDPAYQGEEAMLVPQVGFFYDTVLVRGN